MEEVCKDFLITTHCCPLLPGLPFGPGGPEVPLGPGDPAGPAKPGSPLGP